MSISIYALTAGLFRQSFNIGIMRAGSVSIQKKLPDLGLITH